MFPKQNLLFLSLDFNMEIKLAKYKKIFFSNYSIDTIFTEHTINNTSCYNKPKTRNRMLQLDKTETTIYCNKDGKVKNKQRFKRK